MRLALVALVLLVAPACFTTRAGAPTHRWNEHAGQVIFVGGMPIVPSTLGADCQDGLAYVESEYGWRDGLTTLVGALVAGFVGGMLCDGDECGGRAAGYAAGAAMAFQTRTVRWACVEGKAAPP